MALVDTGGAVVRRGRVVWTHEAGALTLVRLIGAALAVLTDLGHDVEERARRTSHCSTASHNNNYEKPVGFYGPIAPPPSSECPQFADLWSESAERCGRNISGSAHLCR